MTAAHSESLTLAPIARIEGEITLPGSKSLSNRILLLSALADGATEVTNLLDSDDIRVMLGALAELGVPYTGYAPGGAVGSSVTVQGQGGPLPGGTHDLFVGNAGTATRPLTAALTAGQGSYRIHGVPRMHERPIGDLVDGLRQLGARIDYEGKEGYPPLRIHGQGLQGGTARISGTTSSQFVTALCLVAPLAAADVTVEITDRLVSTPYVDMTLALMARFGVTATHEQHERFHIAAGQRYRSPGRMMVEGDASSATYFLAGAAVSGGTVRVQGCGTDSLQGDARFAEVLGRMGAEVTWAPESVRVRGTGPLRGMEVDMEAMPDAAMTLAVAALFAKGATKITGIANWRVKETDRMEAVSTELRKLGAETEVGADHLVVHPPPQLRTASIATYDDHRMAMAFSLAACGGVPVEIQDPACVNKTFPTYFEELAALSRR